MKFALVFAVVCLSAGVSFGANPNYSYHIKIDDPAHANFQEKAETRKGPDAQGFYSVVEPNGALRTVSYTADDRGFNPIVQYSHAGSSVFSSIGTYAPAYVSEKRVQIVDKLTGPPPALNIQPFALPAPSGISGVAVSAPVVVPAPLRVAPAPQLIAQAQGVNYAPAFMPPVSAFVGPSPVVYQPQQTLIKQQVYQQPALQQVVYQQPQLIQKQVVQPQVVYQQPQLIQKQVVQPQVVYQQPQLIQKQVIQPQVVYQQPIVQKQVIQPQVVYQQPIQKQVVYQQPIVQQQVVYQQPIVQKVVQPQVVYQQPIVQKQVIQPQVIYKQPVVQKVAVAPPTKLVTPLVTDSYLPPKNTVIDTSATVYADAKKPEAAYGPPSFTPGEPIGLVETPAPVKVVKQSPPAIIAVSKPARVQVVQQYQPVVQQYQPVVQQYQPVVQKVVQPAPQVLVQQKAVAVAPALGLYAGAIGFHTQNSNQNAYLHSYGTQGFQVTSSRTFNKAVLPVPQFAAAAPVAVQAAPLLQQVVKQPVYAPQYYQPAPQLAYAPAPAPAIAVQAAPVAQVQYGVPAPQYGVPTYAAAAPAKLIQSAPVAVTAPIAGKKQNPLTFAYSYDQGGAKVSHSYSGSGW